MATSKILAFSPNNTGTNLLTDAEYLAASGRTNGNQPGVASAKLVNKALRQSSLLSAALAQVVAEYQSTDVEDDISVNDLAGMMIAALGGRLIGVRRFSGVGSTTYVPTDGTASIVVEVQGGGGAGGGSVACGVGESNAGPGGGSGGYAKSRLTSGFSGAIIEVGAGGVGSIGGDGSEGGSSSFGAIVAPGGSGGDAPPISYSVFPAIYGHGFAGAVGVNGSIFNGTGQPGFSGIATSPIFGISGCGGASNFGGGGDSITSGITSAGRAAVSYGAGGGGAMTVQSGEAQPGGTGKSGVVIVYEYA